MSFYEIVNYKQFKDIFNLYHEKSDNNHVVMRQLIEWFCQTRICFKVDNDGDFKSPLPLKNTHLSKANDNFLLYSPTRLKIGVYQTLKLARDKNGILNRGELLESLYEIDSPTNLPYSPVDVNAILLFLKEKGFCSGIKDRYIFPLYLTLPNKNNDEINKKVENSEEKLEFLYKWIETDPISINSENTIHYIAFFDFISNSILSAIILKTQELFENKTTFKRKRKEYDNENNPNYKFTPLSDKNGEGALDSWYPIGTDGAFFLIQDNDTQDTVKIFVGRTLHIIGRLHIYAHLKTQSRRKSNRQIILNAISIVMRAVREVYKKLPGYKIRLNYRYEVDVQLNGERANIRLDDIEKYREVGLKDVYIPSLNQNPNIENDLVKKYFTEIAEITEENQ